MILVNQHHFLSEQLTAELPDYLAVQNDPIHECRFILAPFSCYKISRRNTYFFSESNYQFTLPLIIYSNVACN